MRIRLLLFLCALVVVCTVGLAQSVQPVISEYREHAEGSFSVTNTTLVPMVAVMEPRSFSVSEDGNGEFRPLDDGIQIELSSMSLRLEPKQTATVFYRVKTLHSPAWLVVYTTFSPLHPNDGLNVRIMLPHTIYIFQKQPLGKDAIAAEKVLFDVKRRTVSLEVTNRGAGLTRVQSVELSGHRATSMAAGFPLLPGASRKLTLDWTAATDPERLTLQFANFDLKLPIAWSDE